MRLRFARDFEKRYKKNSVPYLKYGTESFRVATQIAGSRRNRPLERAVEGATLRLSPAAQKMERPRLRPVRTAHRLSARIQKAAVFVIAVYARP